MVLAIPHRRLWSPLQLSSAELNGLRCSVAPLRLASDLRGRHLAILCNRQTPLLRAVMHAVAKGGGTVAVLDASLWRSKASDTLRREARMLGRLYDLVDCCDMSQAAVEEIDRNACVPVLDGAVGSAHPLRLLADAMTLQAVALGPERSLHIAMNAREAPELGEAFVRCAAATGLQWTDVAELARLAASRASDGSEHADVELDLSVPLHAGRLRLPGAISALQDRLATGLAALEAAVVAAAYAAALA